MALWISLLVGVVAGFLLGGRKSLRLARRDELVAANRHLWRGGIVAAITAIAMTMISLGWPFVSESGSEPYEVTKRVTETVEFPVQVTRWVFWTVTEMQSKEVPKDIVTTAFRNTTVSRFSFWMLVPLALVGCVTYYAELWIVRAFWRWRG